jgi:hypothetical protein
MDGQFEIVIYRLKADVDGNQFVEISDQATDWLRNRPGYLGRELLEDDSGQWVDLVRWATMKDALAAASAFMEVPQAAFMAPVEPESITMLHPRRVVRYEQPRSPHDLAILRNEKQTGGGTRGEIKP